MNNDVLLWNELTEPFTTVYCDMDGVLAHFTKARKQDESEKEFLERFKIEKDFFKNLEPIEHNVNALKQIIKQGCDIKILSASPNKRCDRDKVAWLKKYLPEIKEKDIIIMPLGKDKTKYVEDVRSGLLIDDYTNNLIDWKNKGGKVIKMLNTYDNEKGKHTENDIPYIKSIANLVG